MSHLHKIYKLIGILNYLSYQNIKIPTIHISEEEPDQAEGYSLSWRGKYYYISIEWEEKEDGSGYSYYAFKKNNLNGEFNGWEFDEVGDIPLEVLETLKDIESL
jgi:hypothetical protein